MRVVFVSVSIVIVDQITKLLVKGLSVPPLGIHWEGMRYGTSIPVLGDFFRLTYIENAGMAFGIDVGGKLFFSIVSIVASIAILVYLYRARHTLVAFRLSLALILGGALGNLIDRAFYGILFNGGALFSGRVVDFFDVDFFDITIGSYQLHRWPVFNIADACVSIGVILLLFVHRSAEEKSREAAVAGGSPTPDAAGTDKGS